MKAIIERKQLALHQKTLKNAKPSDKKIVSTSGTAITFSESITIDGPGFRQKFDGRVLTWGRATVPLRTWTYLIMHYKKLSTGDPICIEIQDGELKFDNSTIRHDDIRMLKSDELPLDMAVNTELYEIIKWFNKHDLGALRASGMWPSFRAAMDQLRGNLQNATNHLTPYGITVEDLAVLAANKMGIKNRDRFIEILFQDDS